MVAHAEAAAAAALSLTPRLTPRPTVRADRASLAPKLTPRPPVASLSPRHQPLSPRHQQPAGAVPPTASTLSPRLAYVSRNSTPEITLVTPRDRSLATAAALESSAPFELYELYVTRPSSFHPAREGRGVRSHVLREQLDRPTV